MNYLQRVMKIQHLVETAIREQRPGFRAGFISSIALKDLVFQADIILKPRDLGVVLRALRYIPHPQLSEGYVRKELMKTNQKLYLYTSLDGPAYTLFSAEDVVKAYQQTNT